MMLSYHGAEHFNSVRDDTAGLPPPPQPQTAISKPTAVNESTDDITEVLLKCDEDKMDIDETVAKQNGTSAKPPKKKSACPCGSGLRYKKCCLEADKSKERARKWKAKHGSDTSDDHAMEGDSNDDENEEKMGGNFRVLKI